MPQSPEDFMCKDRLAPSKWLLPLMLLLSACGDAPQDGQSGDVPSSSTDAPSSNAARRSIEPEKTTGLAENDGAATTGFPADMIVIRANGPSGSDYPIGRSLTSGTLLDLVAGDRLVLLGTGGTRTLAGPGTFLSGGADFPSGAAQNTSLLYAAALLQADGQSAAAATRRVIAPPDVANAVQQLPHGPGLWAYTLGTSGNHCLPNLGDFVVSTRPSPTERTITITPQSSGAARSMALVANASRVGRYGPQMTNGARYRIGFDGGNGASIRIVQIVVDRSNPAALASTLARAGCIVQLDRLLARLSGVAPIAPPAVAAPRIPVPERPTIIRPRPEVIMPVLPTEAAPPPPAPVTILP
ncbi:MAG: hypothetical protein ABL882_11035, partial [Sphingopyxis sp.]